MRLESAGDGVHKYKAVFNDGTSTKFGAKGYKDYTIYYGEDPTRAMLKKASYLARHKTTENWNDPKSAGALSRYILWNKPTVEASLSDYRRRFRMNTH